MNTDPSFSLSAPDSFSDTYYSYRIVYTDQIFINAFSCGSNFLSKFRVRDIIDSEYFISWYLLIYVGVIFQFW